MQTPEQDAIYAASDKSFAGRHRLFLEANRVVRRPSIFGYDDAWGCGSEVLALALEYIRDVKNKTLVFINHEHKKVKYLPYRTRFDSEYAKRIARKWKKITYTEGIFLTLTLNPNRFSSFYQAYTGMIEGWNKIVTAIRKRYPNFIGYARVVEFQESGNPHLHIMLFGVDFVPVEWIRELWENHYGLGTQINVKRITNDKGAIRYLLKYLLKSFTGNDIETENKALKQKALLWAVNSKGWAVSKSLISLMITLLVLKTLII